MTDLEQCTATEFKQLLLEIRNNVNKNNDNMVEIKLAVTKLNENFTKLASECQTIKNENVIITEKIRKQELEIKHLRNKDRENNLIIYNLDEEGRESYEILEEKVINTIGLKMETGIDSSDVVRVGRLGQKGTNRPVLVKMATFKSKINVLKSGIKLKGSNISVTQDFSPEIREIRNRLLPHMMHARALGEFSIIKGNKLLIKDKLYTVEELNLKFQHADEKHASESELEASERSSVAEKSAKKSEKIKDKQEKSSSSRVLRANRQDRARRVEDTPSKK